MLLSYHDYLELVTRPQEADTEGNNIKGLTKRRQTTAMFEVNNYLNPIISMIAQRCVYTLALEASDREQVSCDIYASHLNISRQRSGLDSSYGSSESLDQIILEYDHVSEVEAARHTGHSWIISV